MKPARLIILDSVLQGENARWTASCTPEKCFSPRTFPKRTGGTVETGAKENIRVVHCIG